MDCPRSLLILLDFWGNCLIIIVVIKMHSPQKILLRILGTLLAAFIGTNALAEYEPNNNYSSLVLAYQSTNFATPVCIGSECHDGLAGPSIVYAQQIISNLALGISGSYLQSSGNTSSITSTNISPFVEVIAGLGNKVDVGSSVAVLNTNFKLCSTNPDTCSSTSDTGSDLGVFGKVFLNDAKSINVGLSYNVINFQKSSGQSIVGLSLVVILAKQHRLDFSVDRVRDSSGNAISGGFGFGYSFLVF